MDECECAPRKIKLKILPLPESAVKMKKIYDINIRSEEDHLGNEMINNNNLNIERLKIDRGNNSHNKLMVGSHVGLMGTLYETVSKYGMSTCQCYLGSHVSYQSREISELDRGKTLNYCDTNGSTFYIHCPLIANVANAERDDIPEKSLKVISAELNAIHGLPGACVLHIGKRGTIQNVVNRLNNLEFKTGDHHRMRQQLLMENAAGQGTELGSNWDELRHLYEGLDTSRIGLCMDTQHSFAAGLSKFQTSEEVDQFFENVNSIVKSKTTSEHSLLRLIHLNDSVVPFGKKVDRHASLGHGYIWRENSAKEGLIRLIEQTKDRGIDLISETPTPFEDIIITQVLEKTIN